MKESDKPVRDRSLGCGLIEERDRIGKERVNLGVIRVD